MANNNDVKPYSLEELFAAMQRWSYAKSQHDTKIKERATLEGRLSEARNDENIARGKADAEERNVQSIMKKIE